MVTQKIETRTFDVDKVRADFPALSQKVHGKPLVYLDNAASSQTLKCVVDTLSAAYLGPRANVHRGVHTLSQRATTLFEDGRKDVQRFMNAREDKEIVFTRGTTEAINLIARVFPFVPGDEILISALEHHSNIVPWQLAAERTGAKLVVAPIDDDGQLEWTAFKARLSDKTRLVSMAHISNALGTVLPVHDIIREAHAIGAQVLLDGAQAVPHGGVDVQALDVDFYAFSSHKVFGPTGIGVLYGKADRLSALPPFHGGGEMIETVTFEKSTWAGLPNLFEAGTPDITGSAGLGRALTYLLDEVDMNAARTHEHRLLEEATERAMKVKGLRVIGTAADKASVLSFEVAGVHPHDLGMILDQEGIAVRTGHHCAQPAMARFGVTGTCRASFAFYNTHHEVDHLINGLELAVDMLT